MKHHISDLQDLVSEIKQAHQQLSASHAQKEQALQTFKHMSDLYDQADSQYVNLIQVFEYCVQHDCDATYAKIMLSECHAHKSHRHKARGHAAPSLMEVLRALPVHDTRTIKQKVVDWWLKK